MTTQKDLTTQDDSRPIEGSPPFETGINLDLTGKKIGFVQKWISSAVAPLLILFLISIIAFIVIGFFNSLFFIFVPILVLLFSTVFVIAFFSRPYLLMSETYNFMMQKLMYGDEIGGLKEAKNEILFKVDPGNSAEEKEDTE